MAGKHFLRILLILCFTFFRVGAQDPEYTWKALVFKKDATWFATSEAATVASNLLLYQRDIGGWPKNIPFQEPLPEGKKEELLKKKKDPVGSTIDNGATTTEMYFLARLYKSQPQETYREALIKALDYLLEAQYENGGWPQFYPLIKGYYSHITYNDNAMVNVMKVLKEVMDTKSYFGVPIPEDRVYRSRLAFQKGVICILNTQYVRNGELTAWCAQHDATDLLPAQARAYELPSLSGSESVGITRLLMSIDDPSEGVIRSVEAAVRWFEKTKITGIRQEWVNTDGVRDRKVVKDPLSGALWARFMDLETDAPFFCDRDGIRRKNLADIGIERRTGYGWYSDAAVQLLQNYPEWKNKYANYDLIVAADGSGDYTTIQGAIDATKAFPPKRMRIYVKSGVYKEKVRIPDWNPMVSLIGEDREKTRIVWGDFFDQVDRGRNSTFMTATLSLEGDDCVLKNLTIENTAGPVGQAIALTVSGNRCFLENCSMLGNQDTVYLTGENHRQYFKNCRISGTTDFIFGNATVLFEDCVLVIKADSYVTAASTPEGTAYGFVFKDCQLKAGEGVEKIVLGRPWRTFAKTAFLYCELPKEIAVTGWNDWNNQDAHVQSEYLEFENYGPGANIGQRPEWIHLPVDTTLTRQHFSKVNILKDRSNPLKALWFEEL
ncbi:pectate lyase [Robertkochia solimangrovi]|uniref:pectate lyase n=1 Tax=Robertkochia solimangrovi TaxID=2213046 RepID=UPI00117D746C|nr:pectate lyase [Robertkochia solimangrovi]